MEWAQGWTGIDIAGRDEREKREGRNQEEGGEMKKRMLQMAEREMLHWISKGSC